MAKLYSYELTGKTEEWGVGIYADVDKWFKAPEGNYIWTADDQALSELENTTIKFTEVTDADTKKDLCDKWSIT
tara:strand:+ start:21 stop:242 length:222 start_codon:yes stop_codon:yes gene_type:complete